MAQHPKIVDLTRSFVVTDPNAFPQNLMYTKQEDAPEETLPILAFEGYNFLPTPYGYRSFFGTNATLAIAALTSRCDMIILYQFGNYQNILVALCEDGIWISRPNVSANTWTHSITLAIPAVGSYLQWTYTTIENKLFMYRQGDASYYQILPTGISGGVVTVLTKTPSFLNMAGQMGIFRANGRLAFWDSANSVGWSSLFDFADFTPSLTTLAGNSIFNSVIGRIVTIVPQGDGFVIYTTKGIVGVRYSVVANILWDASTITDSAGIAYPTMVTRGLTELEHFAFTNTGVKRIGTYNALSRTHLFEDVLTDVYDYLKESRQPIRLNTINGRYLCIQAVDPMYIDGKTLFTYNTIDALMVRILVANNVWDGIFLLPVQVDGVTIQIDMGMQIDAGVYAGMYLQWLGTGSVMYQYKVDSAIKPYTLDGVYAHVPNTNVDLGATLGFAGNAASGLLPAAIANCVPENSPYPVAIPLGWTSSGNGHTSNAYKGLVDSKLSTLIATQIEEWNNFTTVQAANKAALEAIPSSSSSISNTGILYSAQIGAQDAINTIVATHGGSGNSYTLSETTLGSFLSGAGITGAGVVSGVGTDFSTYSCTRTFLGGWDVKRRVTRTYSPIQAVSPQTIYYLDCTKVTLAPLAYSPDIAPQIGPILNAIGIIFSFVSFADCLAKLQTMLPGGLTYTNPNPPAPPPPYVPIYYINLRTMYGDIEYQNSLSPPGIYGSFATFLGTAFTTATVYPWNVQYVDVTSIPPLTANPTITLDSTITAYQTNMSWAYFPQGVPTAPFVSSYGAFTVPSVTVPGTTLAPLDVNITFPGSTFLLQDGSVGPIYPTYAGAFVLDLALKKWGKMKAAFKTLLDYQPVNDSSQPVTYTNFGLDIGMLDAAGAIKLFDAKPADSWIRYGKIGFYRLGMTQLQEVKVHFRSSSSGTIELDSSFNGRALELVQHQIWNFTTAADTVVYSGQTGRWHTVKITGNYDLTYMEVRAIVTSRR